MPSTLKLKYTKTWKVIRVTPKIAMLPFSSRYDLVLQWVLGVSLDNPLLWEVWTLSSWALQQAPELPATQAPRIQLSGVIAGAGLARKARHRFHNISSLTTAEDHFYPFSSFTAHPVVVFLLGSGCEVSLSVCDPWSFYSCAYPPALPPCLHPAGSHMGFSGHTNLLFWEALRKDQPPQEMFWKCGHSNVLCQRPYSWCRVIKMIHTRGLKYQQFSHGRKDELHLFWFFSCAQS